MKFKMSWTGNIVLIDFTNGEKHFQINKEKWYNDVFEMKNEFSKRFPGIPTFISYQAPNFKLRAGDFETNQEASAFLKKVKPFFPSSFVIEETVKSNP